MYRVIEADWSAVGAVGGAGFHCRAGNFHHDSLACVRVWACERSVAVQMGRFGWCVSTGFDSNYRWGWNTYTHSLQQPARGCVHTAGLRIHSLLISACIVLISLAGYFKVFYFLCQHGTLQKTPCVLTGILCNSGVCCLPSVLSLGLHQHVQM